MSMDSVQGEKKWEMPPWSRKEEPMPKSAVIVDDIILAAVDPYTLLFYFSCVLEVLQHHRVTANLRKSRFFPKRAEFVGVDVLPSGNAPAQSKNKAIRALKRPITFTNMRLLIGLLGFYRNWIPLYETRIAPWRKILKQQPATGTVSKEEEAEMMNTNTLQDHRQLLLHPISFFVFSFVFTFLTMTDDNFDKKIG